MVQPPPSLDQFKEQLRRLLRQEAEHCRTIQFAKHAHVYTCGAPAGTIYFVESGLIKLLMLAPNGHECLLALLTTGDIFGELCLAGLDRRQETATAMETTIVKAMPRAHFLVCLRRAALFEGFVQYLAVRIADQQEIIANLVTVDSEQRLGKTLLYLASKLGKPEYGHICIEQRISHEELSLMVGTTRPRISTFINRFQEFGLIEVSSERFLIIKEEQLSAYLEQIA
jgi:CRP/FNR family transcriptional regulator, cyclic AMP receptor protein